MAKRFLILKEKLEKFQNFSFKFRCSFSLDSVFALLAFGVLARLKLCHQDECYEKILFRRLETVNKSKKEAFCNLYNADKRCKEDAQVLNFNRDEICEDVVELITSVFKEMIVSRMDDEIVKDRIQNNYLLCQNSILTVFRRFSSVFRFAVVFLAFGEVEHSYDSNRSCPVVFLCQEDDQSFSLLCHSELINGKRRGNNLSDIPRFPFVLDISNIDIMKETMNNYAKEYHRSLGFEEVDDNSETNDISRVSYAVITSK